MSIISPILSSSKIKILILNEGLGFQTFKNTLRTLEMKRLASDKEIECKSAFGERDHAKDRLRKQTEDFNRLKEKYDALMEQTVSDREKSSVELNAALNNVTDLSIQQTKVSTENTSLKAVIERCSERVLILESEIEKNRQENEKLLKIEIDRRDSEIAKLKDDYLKQSNEFSQKNMLQRMQISDLTTKLSSLDSTFAQERLDLKKATDDAISSVMATEQKKYDSLVSESKKASESYVASKQELEVRCNGYITEINSLRDEHGKHIEQVMSQMNSLEHEAKRLRSQNVLLKESVSSSTSENAVLKRELDDTKKRLLLSLEDSEDCHRTLQEAITERQELRSKIDKLGSELEHSVAMRSKEFDLISQTLSTTLEKEFQSLKVNLKIKELKK